MLQWLMKGLGMTKKKSISPSNKEKDRKNDCQSIEEPKRWHFNWRKMILLEPTAELIILIILALLYGGFYYYDHYTVNKDNIYGLWQSDHHKLAISYKHLQKGGNIDWQVVQDGKYIIYAARTRPIKRFNDGTLYIEVYAKERLLSVLPAKNGLNYLNMYVRKDNYLTYNGESYKLMDDRDKSITWKDGSKSPYGQRITLFDRLEPYLLFGMWGGLFIYVLFVEWKIRRKYKNK